MWIHDSKTQAIIDVNEAALTKYGYTRDEFLALSVRDIRIMQDEDITDSLPPSGECRHYKKNGEVIDVAVITHKLNYGEIETVLVMAQDITERKRAQNALHESEQILKESQTIAGIGSYVLDLNTGTWTSSAALDQIFGIDESYNHSIEGWLNLIHPEQQQEMSDYFINEVAGKRTRFDREYRIVRKNDQAERWVHGLGELEIDSQNNLLKMHGVIQDITKHKQAKDALRRQLNNLNSLYQMTAIIGQTSSVEDIYEAALNSLQSMLLTDRTAILLLDQNGVMRFKTWHGISEEYRNAVEGHSPWDVKAIDPQPFPVPDARKEPSLTALLNALEQENIRSLVFIPLINQGHLLGKFMIYYNEPHVFTNEEIQLAQTIARHVTFAILRRQSEDELHLRSSVLNAAANAIVITNIDGIIEWVNPAFSTLTGYTLEEAVNKTKTHAIL